jgi:hypothetical protein
MRALWVSVLIGIANPAGASAALVNANEVGTYCDSNHNLATHHALSERILANVGPAREGGSPDWREFKTAEERSARDTEESRNESADVHLRAGRVVYARFLFQSESQDWTLYVDYCFQPDGSLARVNSELRTFHGDVRVIRVVTYGSARTVLSQKETVFDLQSGEAIDERELKKREFVDNKAPVFWSVKDLPFNALLGRPALPNKEFERTRSTQTDWSPRRSIQCCADADWREMSEETMPLVGLPQSRSTRARGPAQRGSKRVAPRRQGSAFSAQPAAPCSAGFSLR